MRSHKSASKIIARKSVTDLDWNRVTNKVTPPAKVVSFTPKISSALTISSSSSSSNSDRQLQQLQFPPPINFNFSRTSYNSNGSDLENEFRTQLQLVQKKNQKNNCWQEVTHNNSDVSTTPSSSSSSWNTYFGSSIDFDTKSEVFDHNPETLELKKSTGNNSCNSNLPSDPILLSSGKWWTHTGLKNGTGAAFQRVEQHQTNTESVVSRQVLAKFGASASFTPASGADSSPLALMNDHSQNFSIDESETTAQALRESMNFDKNRNQAHNLFHSKIELADRSPLYVTNSDMSQWCVAGDTISFPLNLRRHLLNFYSSYCMKVFGGVPVSGECVTMKSNDKNGDGEASSRSVLILGPLKSGKTSLAKHVVAEDPERIKHSGSGIVIVAPTINHDQNSSSSMSSLRLISLPISSTFSDAGILFHALNNTCIECLTREGNTHDEQVAQNLKKWASNELKRLPSVWKEQLLSNNNNQNEIVFPNQNFFSTTATATADDDAISSTTIDSPFNAIVTLNWAAETLGSFEEEMMQIHHQNLSASPSASGDGGGKRGKKLMKEICRNEKYPCYVRDMSQTEVAQALSHSSCPPYLSKGIYFHEPKRLSDQLFDWGYSALSSNDSQFVSATEINGAVRFDLARRHVKSVLEECLEKQRR